MNQQRFQGKVAVVTGGNSGIGLGAAKAFAREGASVAITGRNEKTLKAAADEIGPGTLAIQSDAARIPEIESAMSRVREKFGRIDALFVNAGVGKFAPIDQITEAFFDDTFDVNVKGVLFTVQKALPLMSSGSTIVLMASINGHKAMLNSIVYASSKSAVIGMTRNLAIDLVERGIRVNSVSPGPIESALLARSLDEEGLQKTKDWIVSQVPMKRFGKPEDIAAAVLYLSSAESAYVTGADLIIDGGMETLS